MAYGTMRNCPITVTPTNRSLTKIEYKWADHCIRLAWREMLPKLEKYAEDLILYGSAYFGLTTKEVEVIPYQIIHCTKEDGLLMSDTDHDGTVENPMTKRRVIIESPYAGNIERNVAYANRCLADSIRRGEAPFSSHLLYPSVLNDLHPDERALGISLGYAWMSVAHLVAIYNDYGISDGMANAIIAAEARHIPIEYRSII